jgi:hypothetical protein
MTYRNLSSVGPVIFHDWAARAGSRERYTFRRDGADWSV